jgi:DNA-binding NarL/FixJ family response regulator
VAVRVLLAEDQPGFTEGLAVLLGRDPRIEIVGTARDGGEAVDLALASAADVVVMDLMLPRVDGLQATRRLCEARPEARVVVLSAATPEEAEADALRAGAAAFVTKSLAYETIVDTILRVAS